MAIAAQEQREHELRLFGRSRG